jgi:hypothetical protein
MCLLDVVLAPYKLNNMGLFERNMKVIGDILNMSFSRRVDVAWRQYREKMRSLRRKYKELCYRVGDASYCLYQYSELSAKEYVRTPLLSMMRGSVVKWYDNGEYKVVAFPFSKFFNYGEVEETRFLPSGDYMVTEKLDGTLIIVWRDDNGELHFNTRGLLEWFSVKQGKGRFYVEKEDKIANPYVLAFIKAVKRMELWEELERLVRDDTTVMFELVGRIPASRAALMNEAKIDPDDPHWVPYALAVRDNKTYKLEYIDDTFFPIPRRIEVTEDSIVGMVSEWRDREGVVLYYPDRHYRDGDHFKWWNYLVKVKSPKYGLLSVINPGKIIWRNVAKYSIIGFHDDISSLVPETRDFVDKIMREYEEIRSNWYTLVEKIDEKTRNILANNMNMKWILKYIDIAKDRNPESAVKRMIIENLPRKKEAIEKFMERIRRKILEVTNLVSE